jgi:hypothetical protein
MTFTTTIHFELINKASLPYLRPHDPMWDHSVDWQRNLKTAYGLTINDRVTTFQQYWPVTFDSEADATYFLLRFA